MKEMPEREDCGKNVVLLEANAAKFGDAPNSHVVYTLKDTFWKKDFYLEFDFRTFYNNGMLLLSKVRVRVFVSNKNFILIILQGVKDHRNLLEIKDGKINFEVNGKRKRKLTLDYLINDGAWHNILIQQITNKKRRKISITLDKDPLKRKQVKIPQNKIEREMYIGGLPDFMENVHQNPFRGCIRSFKINNVLQGLVGDKNINHYNIGQCFPNIEKGAYFGGDSYALYSTYFSFLTQINANIFF